MRRIRPRSVYDVLALASFFLVVGGGTALASFVVSSNSQIGPGTVSGHKPPTGDHANIVNGSINSLDLATPAVGPPQLKAGAVHAPELGLNAVTTPKIAGGAVTGAKLASGAVSPNKLAAGAIGAWGMVSSDGTLNRGVNVQSVTHPNTGIYCIQPAGGIDTSSAILVATPNFSQDDTAAGDPGGKAEAEWASTGCLGGGMAVHTFVLGEGTTSSFAVLQFDEGFSFYIRPD